MNYKNQIQHNVFYTPSINAFEVKLEHARTNIRPEIGNAPVHTHNFYEIFINVSGNIRFHVNSSIYSLTNGNILLIKPNVCHFAIYDHKCINENYVFYFYSPEDSFLSEKISSIADENAFVKLPEKEIDRVLKILNELINPDYSEDEFTTFIHFLTIINLLCTKTKKQVELNLPISEILTYINENFDTIDSVTEIADKFYINIKTMERNFKKYIKMSPQNYLKIIRLTNASKLLREHHSVSEACFRSGFKNYSAFIQVFKNHFGETPFKYKNRYATQTEIESNTYNEEFIIE